MKNNGKTTTISIKLQKLEVLKLKNLKRKIFFAWRFAHTHQLHENKIAKQHEKHEAQRRRSIQIAADSLFFNKEKYNLQETFAKLKQFCLHMKSLIEAQTINI